MYRVMFMVYFSFSLLLFADGSASSKEDVIIQALVNQVKAAKPSEKRMLMNKLKLRLRQSNKAHRMQVIQELKQSFSPNNRVHKRQQGKGHKVLSSHAGNQQPKHKRKGNGSKKGGGGKH